MGDIILRGYIKLQTFLSWLRSVYRLYHFTKYLYKNDIFLKGDPKLILRVIQEFTFWSFREYGDTRVMNRDACESAALLSVLINKWFVSESNVTLNQIMQVLKTEFIEREKNGRKQLQSR